MNLLKKRSNWNMASLLAALAVLLTVVPGLAMATPPATFDETEIITKIGAYVAIGVLIAGAWILGMWTLRVMGFLKPKG